MAVAEAGRLAPPGFLIGRSVHSLRNGARRHAGADYLIFGTVFPTRSKPLDWQKQGWRVWRRRCPPPRRCQCSALAASDADQAAEVARTGAAGVAAIDAFLPTDPAKIADTVHEAVGRMRMAFDSTLPLS